MDPLECLGQTFMGHIKSYNPVKGYGFAVSDKLAGDIFFLHKNLPNEIVEEAQYGRDLAGQEIAFTQDMSPEGKPLAEEIKLIEGGSHKAAAPSKSKGKGKGPTKGGKGSGLKGPHNPKGGYSTAEEYWEEEYEAKPPKGKGKSAAKGGKKEKEKPTYDPETPGIPILNSKRVQGSVKSYSNGSRWGFALVDKSVGNFGDIFVHLNNLDESVTDQDISLHENDIIEFRLERVQGKVVARDITLAAQEAKLYDAYWLKGDIKSFNEGKGYGFINCPRVWGDIWFARSEMPESLALDCVGSRVMFKLTIGPDGKAKAKMVNYIGNTNDDESYERLAQVVQSLVTEGYIDETAAESLNATPCDELFSLLPDLEFYTAENPSSFILGALSRVRKQQQKGKGWASEKGPSSYGKSSSAWVGEHVYEKKRSRPGIGYESASATAKTAKGGKPVTTRGGGAGKGPGKGKAVKGKGGKAVRAAPY